MAVRLERCSSAVEPGALVNSGYEAKTPQVRVAELLGLRPPPAGR